MLLPKQVEDLVKKLFSSLPKNVQLLEEDVKQQFKEVLQSTFAHLDLVTREEFDVQLKVLAKTREKVEHLEKVIYENYNGYYFHHQVGGLINPTLFCYIMEAVQENLRIPKLLKDENVSISENAAVRVILQNAHSEPVLKQLIISGKYKLNKPLESKLDCLELMEDEHSLVQYIYYMGGLTRVKDNENILVIPNCV